MSQTRVVLEDAVLERTTLRIAGTLVDENDVPVPDSQLNTATLDIYTRSSSSRQIVNGNSGTDVLNANQGSFDASGNFVIILSPDDNALINPDIEEEWHRCVLNWTYGAGLKAGRFVIDFRVQNLEKVV